MSFPIVYNSNTTIDLTQHKEKVEGSIAVWNGLTIDATNGKWNNNNGGWIQFNNGTKVSLTVAEGASVTVKTYNDATNYTITITNNIATITATGDIYISEISVTYA